MSYPEDNFKGAKGSRSNPPRNGGRKPKLVKKWVKDTNVSRKDAQNMLSSVLFGYTLKELRDIEAAESDKVSAGTLAFISAVIKAAETKGFGPIKEMLEFLYGKDEQPVTVVTDTRLADIRGLLEEAAGRSEEDRERIIAGLEKAAKRDGNNG